MFAIIQSALNKLFVLTLKGCDTGIVINFSDVLDIDRPLSSLNLERFRFCICLCLQAGRTNGYLPSWNEAGFKFKTKTI
jgi:hypothetical protein